MISADYKVIESNLYEYAVYLQSNQLASSFSYQPKPFREIEELLEKEMRELNKELLHVNVPNEEKGRAMRDFVLKVFSHYQRKVRVL